MRRAIREVDGDEAAGATPSRDEYSSHAAAMVTVALTSGHETSPWPTDQFCSKPNTVSPS